MSMQINFKFTNMQIIRCVCIITYIRYSPIRYFRARSRDGVKNKKYNTYVSEKNNMMYENKKLYINNVIAEIYMYINRNNYMYMTSGPVAGWGEK